MSDEVSVWLSVSGARCRLSSYGPAEATAIPKLHHLLPHLNPDWYRLTHVVPEKEAVKRGYGSIIIVVIIIIVPCC